MPSSDSFKQAEAEYFVLRGQLELRRITREQYESSLRDLMQVDAQGRYWALGVESAQWFVHNGQTWVAADPYSASVVGKPVASSPFLPPSSQPEPLAPIGVPEPYPVASPRPPARPAQTTLPRTSSSTAGSPKPQKGWGCARIGCVTVVALVVLIAAAAAALYWRVPQQLGILPSAERAFADTPDRDAAAALNDDLTKAGIDTRGMEIYVLPFRDKPGSVAYIVLDSAQGFQFKSGSSDPVVDYLKQMAQSQAVSQSGIQRIAIEYKDPKGVSLLSLTAATDTITAFANGTITRTEFLKKLDGQANWVGFYQEVLK
jgi:hypothetical protein